MTSPTPRTSRVEDGAMEFKNVSAAVPRATGRVRGLRARLVMAGDATSLEFALPASFFSKGGSGRSCKKRAFSLRPHGCQHWLCRHKSWRRFRRELLDQ